MSNYTYTSGRPAGNISPAAQRDSMQTNNDNNALIWTQDHYGFNDDDGGTHKFIRIPSNVTLPSTPTGLESGIYTNPGTADPNKSMGYFQNSSLNGSTPVPFPISSIRAAGMFNGTASSPITASNAFNVQSIVRNSAGSYTVNLVSGAVSETNFIVIISTSGSNTSQLNCDYSITGIGQFNILTFLWPFQQQNANSVSFVVLQI